ncbi:MAG: SDR family oxidoreductase [Thermoanaerobaculia bacterium]|nr:SDR family oxidoreductase [Thermoanaerobaculia bacterium]
MIDLNDEIAVVTGASRGIGRATAIRLARAGTRVTLFSRSADELDSLAKNDPERFLAVAGDVTSETDVERAFDETEKRFGPCSLLVNNAGWIKPERLVDVSREDWEKMFSINVTGSFLTIRRALPRMIERGRGSIVNVASISGVPGPVKFPGFVSYCASKGALILMTESLAAELAETPIRVNAVSPGSVDTEMWAEASGGAEADMSPEEVAESIAFLLSGSSRPLNGQNLRVYGS